MRSSRPGLPARRRLFLGSVARSPREATRPGDLAQPASRPVSLRRACRRCSQPTRPGCRRAFLPFAGTASSAQLPAASEAVIQESRLRLPLLVRRGPRRPRKAKPTACPTPGSGLAAGGRGQGGSARPAAQTGILKRGRGLPWASTRWPADRASARANLRRTRLPVPRPARGGRCRRAAGGWASRCRRCRAARAAGAVRRPDGAGKRAGPGSAAG